jgi:signal transduction histidine kinase
LKQVEKSGFVQDFGVQVVRLDGSTFDANLNMSKLVLDGQQQLLVMVEDVTAQIAAEQETATLEERARLARELHDAVTQTLVSASLLSDATTHASEEGRVIETQDLVKLSQLLRGAVDEMRTLLLEMRPSAKHDRTLGQLLASLAESTRTRSPAKVNLRIEGDRLLPENVTTTLQRIAQESLNNATRHAEAKTVNVDLVCDPDGVALRITDDGRGFDVERVPAGHHGLSIMLERAQEIGAVFEIHSKFDEGTEISVTWS